MKERRRRRRRKKKKPRTDRSERKKKPKTANQEKKGRKKSQKWSKVVAGFCLWVSYVCLITILPLSYKLWKLKTVKMCF